ncbi:MAG: rod shape-determining protein MreC [Schwartzia sp. (in: firmicutes)]
MNKIKREPESGRKVWILVFVTVSIFCIVFFAARGRFVTPWASGAVITALAPFQRAATWLVSKVNGGLTRFEEIMTVYEQNQQLRREVEELRAQNIKAEEFSAENVRMRELLGYKNLATQFDLVVARVIGREAATWTRMIAIDRGTQHGIQKNMAVVTARGLVGVVTEAGLLSSKVELILDPRISVGALVQRSRVAGIVEGNPENTIQPRLVHIPRNEDIAEEDVIVTSGFGGIYPKGIVIGKIHSIRNDSTGLLHLAEVETAVDFQRLEDVAVIVASREAPPEPITPPPQTPGTETDPRGEQATWAAAEAATEAALRQAAEAFQNASPAAVPPSPTPSPAVSETAPSAMSREVTVAVPPSPEPPARPSVRPATERTR